MLASVGLPDHSKLNILNLWYKIVNFGTTSNRPRLVGETQSALAAISSWKIPRVWHLSRQMETAAAVTQRSFARSSPCVHVSGKARTWRGWLRRASARPTQAHRPPHQRPLRGFVSPSPAGRAVGGRCPWRRHPALVSQRCRDGKDRVRKETSSVEVLRGSAAVLDAWLPDVVSAAGIWAVMRRPGARTLTLRLAAAAEKGDRFGRRSPSVRKFPLPPKIWGTQTGYLGEIP